MLPFGFMQIHEIQFNDLNGKFSWNTAFHIRNASSDLYGFAYHADRSLAVAF